MLELLCERAHLLQSDVSLRRHSARRLLLRPAAPVGTPTLLAPSRRREGVVVARGSVRPPQLRELQLQRGDCAAPRLLPRLQQRVLLAQLCELRGACVTILPCAGRGLPLRLESCQRRAVRRLREAPAGMSSLGQTTQRDVADPLSEKCPPTGLLVPELLPCAA